MNVMTYKGYMAPIEFDAEDGLLVGHIAGINDVVGFHASSVEELNAAFHEAVDDYLETCKKVGKSPDKPFSGQVMVRVRPEVHARSALAAQVTGKSLAQWADEVFDTASRAVLDKTTPA
jgi:predicted HicB family RNase H-like nuclease